MEVNGGAVAAPAAAGTQSSQQPGNYAQDADAWRKRVKQAIDTREPHLSAWSDLHKYLTGRNFRSDWKSNKATPINQLNNFCRIVLPHLLPRDRRIEIVASPKRAGPEYAAGAQQMSDRLTAWLQAVRAIDHFRRAARSSFYSLGWLKVGFEARTGIVGEVPAAEDPQQKVPVDVDQDRVERQEYFDADLPYLSWVPAGRMAAEPGATMLDSAGWIVHVLYRRVDALRKDPRFSQWADKLEATHHRLPASLESDAGQRDESKDARAAIAELYEIHDRDAQKIITICGPKGCAGLYVEAPWTPGVEGFPVARIDYEEVEDFFYPNPPLSPTLDLCTTVDMFFAYATEAATQAKKLILYDPENIKPEHAQAIVNAENNGVVPVPGLSKFLQVVDMGGNHPDVFVVGQQAKGLADEMMGIGQFRRGIAASGSDTATATEVQAALAASGVTLEDMRAANHGAIARVAQIAAGIFIANQDALADVVLPVGNPQAGKFADFSGEVIGNALDYAFELKAASTEKIDPAIKQKRNQDLIQMSLDPNMAMKLQSEGRAMLTAPLIDRHLRDMGETDTESYFIELPPPGSDPDSQQAMAEDEQMLTDGEPLPVDPGENHQAHLQIHTATAQQTGSQAVAQHAMMHEQFAAQQPQQAPPPGQPMAGAPMNAPMGGASDQRGAMQREATAGVR